MPMPRAIMVLGLDGAGRARVIAALDRLRAAGTFEAIWRRYLGVDTPNGDG
jgi:ABC-type amino acid transport substrate-binding protein